LDNSVAVVARLGGVGLRYGAGASVLSGIDLKLHAGSFQFLVGPSGAGKTSLLRLLGLAHRPCAGSIELFGRDVAALTGEGRDRLRRRIGFIFQDLRLIDELDVLDNAALPLRLAGVDDTKARSHASLLLTWLGLGTLQQAAPSSLSMGQRQLVAAARAVVCRPGLLLADEPTSYLDPELVSRLMRLMGELTGLGTAVLVATHSRELVALHPHPVLRLAAGRLGAAEPAPLRAAA
jgi:cell division transport system ATP-binding protein